MFNSEKVRQYAVEARVSSFLFTIEVLKRIFVRRKPQEIFFIASGVYFLILLTAARRIEFRPSFGVF